MERSPKVIIGIDPGLASTGYGIIYDYGTRCVHRADGTISTTPQQPLAERLFDIHSAIQRLAREYKPDIAGVEGIYFAKNSSSAIPVAQVLGVIVLALYQCGVPVCEYAPQHIKRTITDYGRATKDQVRTMVRSLLACDLAHRITNHAVDGLAIALSCAHSQMPDYVS